MSDIKVGDLVVVVRRADCGCGTWMGYVGTVALFQGGTAKCVECRKVLGPYMSAKLTNGWWFAVHRLKRIPPLEELEGEKREEKEPA